MRSWPSARLGLLRSMTSLFQHMLLGLVLAIAVPVAMAATDAELRAAVIYNIARFVQWPPTSTSEHFAICTLGDNPVTEALGALAGKVMNGAPATVRAVQDDRDLRGCHLLYVAEENVPRMTAITEVLANERAATLTISDAPSFLAIGGMVQLVVLNDRQRFRINQELAERAKLGMNAKLLQLALPGID